MPSFPQGKRGEVMAGILVVFGTRPEAIKLWPVIDALKARQLPTRICVTGQHRELLAQTTDLLDIRPDISLGLMQLGQSIGELTGRLIAALDRVFADERPDRVIVQGDTATAAAAAQAAYFRGVPVAHVEAGLRTGDPRAPHPEEGNRRIVAAVCDLHFAPTETAAESLKREGIDPTHIHVTGNTIVDALMAIRKRIDSEPSLVSPARPVLDMLEGRRLILATCHRRESFVDAPRIASALQTLARRGDVMIALPLHPNPAIRQPLRQMLADIPNILLLEPLDFAPFIALLSAAHFVLTDSGGVQEEAPALGVPALVMRDTTERPEGVAAGTARLVGTRMQRIVAEANRLLDNDELHARMAQSLSPYGDGLAAARITDLLAAEYADQVQNTEMSGP